MIQRLRKAQALTEMAIFGTLILLCLHYLVSYIQRMDRQQYALQESFRSALEKASNPTVGSVGYNVFSNRRQVSINAPLIGERSQISSSGQVYWGAEEYKLDPATGEPTTVKELEQQQYYRFNQDEIPLHDRLTEAELASMGGVDIRSESEVDSSTQIAYNTGNITSTKRSGTKDIVTYEIKDDSGSVLYNIEQAVDDNGEYNEAAYLADKKIYNIMSPDNSDRVWAVSK
ncbi:MAG: hypothetical protein K9L76_02060 [Candidatus Omnitrophica bacterium]|nr:hypothetical protein [Candidatus Omnitrophota bacterium]